MISNLDGARLRSFMDGTTGQTQVTVGGAIRELETGRRASSRASRRRARPISRTTSSPTSPRRAVRCSRRPCRTPTSRASRSSTEPRWRRRTSRGRGAAAPAPSDVDARPGEVGPRLDGQRRLGRHGPHPGGAGDRGGRRPGLAARANSPLLFTSPAALSFRTSPGPSPRRSRSCSRSPTPAGLGALVVERRGAGCHQRGVARRPGAVTVAPVERSTSGRRRHVSGRPGRELRLRRPHQGNDDAADPVLLLRGQARTRGRTRQGAQGRTLRRRRHEQGHEPRQHLPVPGRSFGFAPDESP